MAIDESKAFFCGGTVQKNSLSQKEMYREERRKGDCGIVTKVISILLRLARSRTEAFSFHEELTCMSIVLLTLTFMLGETFITISTKILRIHHFIFKALRRNHKAKYFALYINASL